MKMYDTLRGGHMWNSDISGRNLSRDNMYGTVNRTEFFPGGPIEETFIPKTQDQMIYDQVKKSQLSGGEYGGLPPIDEVLPLGERIPLMEPFKPASEMTSEEIWALSLNMKEANLD